MEDGEGDIGNDAPPPVGEEVWIRARVKEQALVMVTPLMRGQVRLVPLGILYYCDGCGTALTYKHSLQCKKGGLIPILYDNACILSTVYSMVLLHYKVKVKYKPTIHYCVAHCNPEPVPAT